jgi:hypothetical protein
VFEWVLVNHVALGMFKNGYVLEKMFTESPFNLICSLFFQESNISMV